jgi:lysylphosphatidylglycerol synthetase-like protein (DUF2156 family)
MEREAQSISTPALALGSVVFHLTKGWDVEEAVCSGVVSLLLLTRRQFIMGSSRLPLGTAVRRAAIAFLLAGIYGVAGFRLLEPAEFRPQFHWWEAAIRTVRVMLFWRSDIGSAHSFAAWFFDSYWMSAAAFFYSGLILFRPVAYQFSENWRESDLAGRIAEQHGRSAQDYFKQWPDKSYFFSATRQSFRLSHQETSRSSLRSRRSGGRTTANHLTVPDFAGARLEARVPSSILRPAALLRGIGIPAHQDW